MAKRLVGRVTSDKTDKTIVVRVVTHKTHPVYKKRYIASKKFMAHDEQNEAKIGDKVSIVETRPLSARKRFILSKVIERPVLREDQIVSGADKTEKATPNAEPKAAIKEAKEPVKAAKPAKEATK